MQHGVPGCIRGQHAGATNSGVRAALAKIAAMTPNVTAVSYGRKLTDSELGALRSLLAGNGAAVSPNADRGQQV